MVREREREILEAELSLFQRRRGRLREAPKVAGRMAAPGSAARKFVPGKMSE